ncbi:hypothetical protein D3C71_1024710 [compost metagenome]
MDNCAAQQHQNDQRQSRCFQQGTHPGGGVVTVERHDKQPVRACHRCGDKGFLHAAQCTVDFVAFFQLVNINAIDRFCKGFERQRRIVGGNYRTVAVNQQTTAGGCRVNTTHVSHHAVHRHISGDHCFQCTVFFYRHSKRHDQLTGASIDIRGSDHRRIGADYLLIPRAHGRIVIRWHARRIGEFRRFAGVTDVDVGETARLCQLFKYRNRVVAQGHRLRRGNDR